MLFLISLILVLLLPTSFAEFFGEKLDPIKEQIKCEQLPEKLEFDLHSIKEDLHDYVSEDHFPGSYKNARRFIFGSLHLVGDSNEYLLESFYCGDIFSSRDTSVGLGPGRIPKNEVLNTEHSWPQSKFTGRFPTKTQKTDVHHLFPTRSRVNSDRGSYPFGDIVSSRKPSRCSHNAVGYNDHNGQSTRVFEPRKAVRGDVARALFYFSIRYKISILPFEEEDLRDWHKDDPPTTEEVCRNYEIERFQGNRNPFVDQPELVELIDNF